MFSVTNTGNLKSIYSRFLQVSWLMLHIGFKAPCDHLFFRSKIVPYHPSRHLPNKRVVFLRKIPLTINSEGLWLWELMLGLLKNRRNCGKLTYILLPSVSVFGPTYVNTEMMTCRNSFDVEITLIPQTKKIGFLALKTFKETSKHGRRTRQGRQGQR